MVWIDVLNLRAISLFLHRFSSILFRMHGGAATSYPDTVAIPQRVTAMLRLSRPSLLRLFLTLFFMSFLAACNRPKGEEVETFEEKFTPVTIAVIESRPLPLIVESVGRVAANREVTLATEVSGVVKDYSADIGDRVDEGTDLAIIDPRDYQLALKEARANLSASRARLEAATKAHERSKALLPQKAISSDTFDKSEAEYKTYEAAVSQIQATVDIAEERLKKTRISTPFKGVIAERLIEKGQTVGIGTPVMTLVDLDTVRVRIHAAESDYVCVDRNDPVLVTLEAFPERPFKGRIDRIGVKADERTNTFAIEILIENPELLIKAGMSARVRITTGVIPNAILIPQSTVLYREERREVFVVGKDGQADLRSIRLGRAEGSLIQVLEGLKPGERLILSGGQYLKPGDKITISNPVQAVAP